MPSRRPGSIAVLALVCALAVYPRPGLAQAAPADRAAIEEQGRRFSAAFVRGDVATMVSLYTADAVIFPERSEALSGTDAITRYWTPAPGRRVTRHAMTPASLTVDGDHAYEHGIYEIAGERDGTAWGPSRGKYVVVWRREAGGWRMALDIWNSGPPPEP